MLVAGFLNLPDSFAAGAVLAALAVIALIDSRRRAPTVNNRAVMALFAAAVLCTAYSSVVHVPQNKIGIVYTINGKGERFIDHGVRFKLPWETAKVYNDVVNLGKDLQQPEGLSGLVASSKHRHTPLARTAIYSYRHGDYIRGPYLLAERCIRTMYDLIRAGQPTINSLVCRFGNQSFLAFR